MQVHYDEGVAIRIGPEPCVGAREGAGEASAGEHIGQPLSRESLKQSRVPTWSYSRKATWAGASSRVLGPTRRGRRPWHVWKFPVREPGGLGFGPRLDTAGPHRKGEKP